MNIHALDSDCNTNQGQKLVILGTREHGMDVTTMVAFKNGGVKKICCNYISIFYSCQKFLTSLSAKIVLKAMSQFLHGNDKLHTWLIASRSWQRLSLKNFAAAFKVMSYGKEGVSWHGTGQQTACLRTQECKGVCRLRGLLLFLSFIQILHS